MDERILVCLSHSPYSEQLVHAAARLAKGLRAEWFAVNVNTGKKLGKADEQQLLRNIELAESLGAHAITINDSEIAHGLSTIVRQKKATRIMIGRPVGHSFRSALAGGSVLDRLVRVTRDLDIDVHVIGIRQTRGSIRKALERLKPETRFLSYWNTVWALFAIAFINRMLLPFLGYHAVGFLFLLGVLIVGFFAPLGPVLIAAAFSALVWDYFFIPPQHTIMISSPEDIMMCLAFFFVAFITGALTSRSRRQETILREREERSRILYGIAESISSSKNRISMLSDVFQLISGELHGRFAIYLKTRNGSLELCPTPQAEQLSDPEIIEATNTLASGQPTKITDVSTSRTLTLLVPLKTPQDTIGVLVFRSGVRQPLHPDKQTLLFTVSRQLAVAIEREQFEEKARVSARLEESERLHQTLLNSISHEMRTPLTTIIGAASALEDEAVTSDANHRKLLTEDLISSADRLNQVVANLLDMSRLNSGRMELKRDWYEISDLIGVSLRRLERFLRDHRIEVSVEKDLPLSYLDFQLMEHVLGNILLNAAAYSPKDTRIKVNATSEPGALFLTVRDEGPGIPSRFLPQIFEKFYRVPGSPSGGIGLGLSIAKSIVELHGGHISAAKENGSGATITIQLPVPALPELPDGGGHHE